jgi:hypothetical protein
MGYLSERQLQKLRVIKQNNLTLWSALDVVNARGILYHLPFTFSLFCYCHSAKAKAAKITTTPTTTTSYLPGKLRDINKQTQVHHRVLRATTSNQDGRDVTTCGFCGEFDFNLVAKFQDPHNFSLRA